MNIDRFENDGFVVLSSILPTTACDEIASSLVGIGSAGTRHLLDTPWCRQLANAIRQQAAVAPLLPDDPVAVQCTYFAKSQEQNWLVPLHQDLSIPVEEKVDNPLLTGWSEKQGALFVQPPASVLRDLVAVRVHLDACDHCDGALRVVAGSHRAGRLSHEDALRMRDELGETSCSVEKGGAMILKPLLLHASSKATGNSQRRVLHLLFGPRTLPFGLRWQHTV